MCWRAFKCGGAGRERRCDVLTVLLAGEGAGRGQGVLTMHGGAGSGGRRESPLVSHVFGTTSRGSTTRENGSETWAGLTPCTLYAKMVALAYAGGSQLTGEKLRP